MPRVLKRSLYLLAGLSLALILIWPRAAALPAADRGEIFQREFSQSEFSQSELKDRDPQALLAVGRSAYQNQQPEEAIAAWQAAAQGFAQRGDLLQQALALSYLSTAYQSQGDWPQAATTAARSLEQLAQWQSSEAQASARSLTIQGQVLNTQGALQFSQGELTNALESWQRSGRFYQQAGETQRYTGSLINQARTLQVLGYFLQARDTLDQVQAQIDGSDPALQAIGWQSLGDTLRAIGDSKEAAKVYRQGLAAARMQSSSREEAALLLSLGRLAQQQRQDKALSLYQRASRVAPDPLQQAQARVDEFGFLVAAGDWKAADTLARSLLPQLQALPPSRTSFYLQANFAQHLMNAPEPRALHQAADLLAATAQQARGAGDRRAAAYALGYLGSAYEKSQQWGSAETVTEAALLIAQSLNATDMAYQWQWQLGRIFKAQTKADAAIAAYQTAFQSLQALRYDLAAIAPDQQFSFRKSVEPVYRDYVDLLLLPTDASLERLQQARQVIESLQIAELNNFFRSACIEGQAIALDDIDQANAAVIYPIILSDRLEVVVSLPEQPLQHYATPVSRDYVNATLDELRLNLTRPFVAAAGKSLGEEVYRWLVQPIEAELRQSQVTTLVFVPDGSLRSVPMAALFNGDRYLIEDYSIALAPSLQLIAPQPLQRQGLETIAAGLTEARHGFSALSSVALELAQVEEAVPSRVLLNRGFTSETLRQQVEELPYPVVHLATHGQFSSRPEDTFVLAWDRRLNMNEVSAILKSGDLRRRTPIELLILSACETATGDERAALGLAGIAVRAGARSTIASLWSLDDESGAVLMGHLYDELANSEISKAEALRSAQLAMLKHPDYRAPIFWTPYVLVGNWL